MNDILNLNKLKNIYGAVLFLMLMGSQLFAAPNTINLQAKIKKPDGSNLEASDVSFRINYLNSSGNCTVYIEDFNHLSMVGTSGNISFALGSGTKAYPPAAITMSDTLSNASTNTMSCFEGGNYTPTLSTENRKMKIEFVYAGSGGAQTLNNIEINSTPYSMYATDAEKLGGFAANLYMKFSDITTCTSGNLLQFSGSAFSCVAPGTSLWVASGPNIYYSTGNVGVGTSTPTAVLHLKAGTIAAGTAPLKFTSGPNLTAVENGAMEYDGTNLYFSTGGVRNTVAFLNAGGSFTGVSSITGSGALTVTSGGTNTNLTLSGNGTGNVTTAFPMTVTNATASTSTTTGAFQVTGGMGVGGKIFTGGDITTAGVFSAPVGAVGVPSYTFTGDTDTGVWSPVTDTWVVSTAGAERLRINSSGYVGIGTETPSMKLVVSDSTVTTGTLNPVATFESSISGGPGVNQTGVNVVLRAENGSGTQETVGAIGGVWRQTNTPNSGDLIFSAAQGNTLSEVVRVTGYSHRVGIGTSNPTAKLDVTAPSTGAYIGKFHNTSGAVSNGLQVITGTTNSVDKALDISSNGGANPLMMVLNSGEVGINTITPRSKLDVNGTILHKPAADNTGNTTIDLANGNLQYTDDDCQTFEMHNMQDGGSYMFVVRSTNSATCSFNMYSDAGSTALTVKMPPDHAATNGGFETVYNFVVMGDRVYVSWTPGY